MRNATFASCDWIPVLQEKRAVFHNLAVSFWIIYRFLLFLLRTFFMPLNDIVSWYSFFLLFFHLFSYLACSAFLLAFSSLQLVVLPTIVCSVHSVVCGRRSYSRCNLGAWQFGFLRFFFFLFITKPECNSSTGSTLWGCFGRFSIPSWSYEYNPAPPNTSYSRSY